MSSLPAPTPRAQQQHSPRSHPKAQTVAHTAKRPERCPQCGSKALTRKGTRHKKLETVQRWHCSSCAHHFTPSPAELRHKTYPLRIILDGVTFYNLGYTLDQVSAKLKARHGYRVPPSTLSAWIAEHRELTTYARLREQGRKLFPPAQSLRTTKLYHRQVYEFAYHRPKLALLRESREHERFIALADFLEAVPKLCPHELFQDSARASQTAPDFLDQGRLMATEKENFATRTAALILPTVGDNYRRHETLQRFMLANDSVTLAVEVPIWLTAADLAALEHEYGIRLHPDEAAPGQTITGHIDFLQVRNGAVHLLDYKPDARTNRPFAQLTLYALALTRLAGVRLFDIKCAWFNEEQYCEFFPRTILARQNKK